MPFIGEIAVDASFALACFLLAMLLYAVGYLIRAIAAALPNINVAFVHLNFGRYFEVIAQPVESWLVGAAGELASDAQWWARGIAYVATWLFDDVKNCLEWDANQIGHLFNTVIPHAAEHAINSSGALITGEIAALRHDIASAASDFEKVASKDASQALTKAKSLVNGAERDITRVGNHAITVAEAYVDGIPHTIRDYVDGAINAIPRPTLDSIGAAPAAIAGIAAGAAVAVAELASEFESCAVTSCEGPNNLSGLLNGILGLAGLAEFGVFLNDVINNPVAAEAEYSGVFSGLVQGLTTGGSDVWGALESVLGI